MNYPGGKNGSGVYQRIINLMPPHDCYVEPFLGGGAVMRLKKPASTNIGIDLSESAILAVASSLARNGGARRTAPSLTGSAANGGVRSLAFDSPGASWRLELRDGIEYLESLPMNGRTVVYCDPPYPMATRSSGRIYDHEFTDRQHLQLLRCLRKLNEDSMIALMVSSYWSEMYADELTNGWKLTRFDAMTRGGVAEECLWCNFDPPSFLHDSQFVGGDYRERERIRKKTKRWYNRLVSLPDHERQAVRSALDSLPDPTANCDAPASSGDRAVTVAPLVLSLFPGIDLLGRGFEDEGYTVVRGPDLIFGGDIRRFTAPQGRFQGVVAGSPCPDFSRARRGPASGSGKAMLKEFERVVEETRPDWWLLENVPGVPEMQISGYSHQRIDVDPRDLGLEQRRLRHFQFGHRNGFLLSLPRPSVRSGGGQTLLASTSGGRSFEQFCLLQGLPGDFDLPAFTLGAKYRAVGNGVHIEVAKLMARAIRNPVAASTRLCSCGCARPLKGKQKSAGMACRKRLQRKRDAVPVKKRRRVTHRGVTQLELKKAGGSQLPDKFERWFTRKGSASSAQRPI